MIVRDKTAILNEEEGFLNCHLADLSWNNRLCNGVGPVLMRHDEQK